MPPADTGFLIGFQQWRSGPSEDNSPVTGKVDLMLDPGAPVPNELRLIEKDILWTVYTRLPLPPGLNYALDSRELQDRMIERRVADLVKV